MANFKNKVLDVILIFIILSTFNQALSQDSLNQLLNNPTESPQQTPQPPLPQPFLPLPTPPQVQPQAQLPTPPLPGITPQPASAEEKKKKRFHLFWQSEIREKHKKELEDLKKRQKDEIEEIKKKKATEKAQEEAKKAEEEGLKKKVIEKQTENMLSAQKVIDERNKEIKVVKKNDNTVEVITNEEDPLYIKKAEVLRGKTKFMKIKNVELKYKLELHNQTPKIINFVLIIWERKLAFNDTQTLAKEINVAKPITPYEKRIVEYNELDSQRNGEIYKVKIAKVVFEDGTQWKNPAVKDTNL